MATSFFGGAFFSGEFFNTPAVIVIGGHSGKKKRRNEVAESIEKDRRIREERRQALDGAIQQVLPPPAVEAIQASAEPAVAAKPAARAKRQRTPPDFGPTVNLQDIIDERILQMQEEDEMLLVIFATQVH